MDSDTQDKSAPSDINNRTLPTESSSQSVSSEQLSSEIDSNNEPSEKLTNVGATGSQSEPINETDKLGSTLGSNDFDPLIENTNTRQPSPEVSEALRSESEINPEKALQPSDNPVANLGVSDVETPAPRTPTPPAPLKSKKHWVLPSVISIAVVLALAFLWFFLMYLPGRPNAVYSASLVNTGKAMDVLVDNFNNLSPTEFQSSGITGSAVVNGKNFSLTGNLTGQYDRNGNSDTQLGVDNKTEGNQNQHIQVSAELKTLAVTNSIYPDIYFKLTGIDSILSALGSDDVSVLSSLDGKWLELDHNTVQQFVQQFSQDTSSSSSANSNTAMPTKSELVSAIQSMQTVYKKYLFTDDATSAVLVQKKFIGAETKFGQNVYHYQMGVNKQHLADMVNALGQALDSSQLNNWSQKTNNKSLSEQINIKSEIDSINKNLDSNYTFDLWANRHTKLIQAVQFTDTKNSKDTVTIAQTYTGGTVYPFEIDIAGDDNGDSGNVTIKLSYDASTSKFSINLDFLEDDNGNKTTASGSLTITPSKDHAKVDKPANAEPFENVIQGLMTSSLSGPGF